MQRRTFLIGATLAACGGIDFAAALNRTEEPARPLVTDTKSRQIGIGSVLGAALRAGFTTRDQLLAVLAIGVAESSLWSGARKWHPEYGFRLLIWEAVN